MSKKTVECFNKHTMISIVVKIDKDEIYTSQFHVRGLRDVIGEKEGIPKPHSAIKIFGCPPGKTLRECGDELPEGELPKGVVTFVFEVPCAQAGGKRHLRSAWMLTARIARGASFQHLRKELFALAEVSSAFGGFIRYGDGITTVTATSDIEAELYFESSELARAMETCIRAAVRDRWRATTMPTTSVTDVSDTTSVDALKRIFSDHYDRTASPPDRLSFEHKAVGERSSATSVLDVTEIDNESVVDRTKCTLKFEKCHIDADIKGNKKKDTTGNHIPLPSDWHDFFDAYTNDNIASISIVGDGECIGVADGEGRAPVRVHVYFDPSSPDAPLRSAQLRSATQVRPNVFAVTVFKKEASKFVALLSARHNAVVQRWNKIP